MFQADAVKWWGEQVECDKCGVKSTISSWADASLLHSELIYTADKAFTAPLHSAFFQVYAWAQPAPFDCVWG